MSKWKSVTAKLMCEVSCCCFLALLFTPRASSADETNTNPKPSSSPSLPLKVDAFGDPLPQGAIARFGTTRWWHGSQVIFQSYRREDNEMLTVGVDGSARLWNVVSGQTVRQIGKVDPNVHNASAAALTDDRRILAIAENNATIRLWDVNEGKEIRNFRPAPRVNIAALEFSPDGKSLAIKGYEQTLSLFNVETGKEIRKLNTASKIHFGGRGLEFAADGKSVFTAMAVLEKNQNQTHVIKRLEVETGKELKVIKFDFGEDLQVMTLSPDGKTLAWGGCQRLCLWDTATEKQLHEISTADCGGCIDAISFSPDSRMLVTRGNGEVGQLVCQRDVKSGKEIRRFTVTDTVSGFVFSDNGKYMAASTSGNTVRQWEVATGNDRLAAGIHGPVFNVGMAAKGETALTRGGDNQVRVWDVATAKMRSSFRLPADTMHMAVSGDGKWVLASNSFGSVKVWNVVSGVVGKEWKFNSNPNAAEEGTDVDWLTMTADGQVAAARSFGVAIRLFDVATGKQRKLIEFPNYNPDGHQPGPMVFSSDGSLIASLMNGSVVEQVPGDRKQIAGVIDVWEVDSGERVRSIDIGSRYVHAMVFAPNGRSIITTGNENTVSIWEVASGLERAAIPAPTQAGFSHLAVTPDGRRVIGAGMDNIVRVFDLPSAKESRQFHGHQGGVTALALAADGKSVITGGQDTTALVFDLRQLPTLETPRLTRLDPARLDNLWNDLAAADAKQAQAAMLTLLRTPQTLDLIRERLKVSPPANRELVLKLVASLSAEKFSARQRATEELARLGESAENVLNEALKSPLELEAKLRIRSILGRLSPSRSLPTDQLRAVRSLEVLEMLGTEEARQAIESLATHPVPSRLTRDAQVTLKRMRPKG